MFLHLTSYSQSITGFVFSTDNQGISFSSVNVKGQSIGTASNADGFFELNDIKVGEYEFVFSAIGHKKFKKKVKIKQGTNTLNVILEASTYDLDQVVVTGTMKEQFLSASPVKVDVVTQKFLEKIATSNVMEVIENVNGVQKQINCGVCGTNDIHINGMEGPYTLVLINGMPIMSSLSSVYGLNGIPTSLIKQIEIIKGPSSTLYGTEAVAGVINILTKNPKDVSPIELDAFLTSHQEKNIDFAFAPKMNKVDMLFSGNLFQMSHFLDDNADNFSDIPLSERLILFNQWNFKRKSEKSFALSAKYYLENRSGGVKEWDESLRGSDSIYGESIYTDRLELAATYQMPWEEDVRIDASYNYHHQDSYYGDTKYEAYQSIYFANLLWSKRLGHAHDILSGLTYRYQTFIDSTLADVDEKKFIPALFVQDEITFNRKWTTLLGMRSDYHDEHGFIFSPRLNVKFKPQTYTTFRLNAGTGFRIVNLFTEDHAFLTGSREVLVVEDLLAEESYNINLNANHIFSLGRSTGTLDFDAFYTYFTNKITPDYDSNPNQIIYANLDGFSVSRGVAFQIQQNFDFPMSLKAGGTVLDVYSVDENNEREDELFAPSFSGVFSLSYKWNTINTSMDWTAKVTGPMFLPTFPKPFERAEVSPWFSQHHLQIKKVFSEKLSAYIGLKNVFNYTQDSPLIDWQKPFGDDFDTSYAYGPLQSRRFLFGLSIKL
ncbi:TonB-dependent receptor [Flavobacteriales bacterium]|nr:TonB-dependent receptor [Flavobacteriales bacterium]